MQTSFPPGGSLLADRRREIHAWILIGFLILIQFLLFRQNVIREILWSYPTNHDQIGFLRHSHTNYFNMLDHGFWMGIYESFREIGSASALLSIQGGLVFYFFGPERFSALALNFGYFALLQVVIAHTVRQITGYWSMSFIALGLLIGTQSRFLPAGGLADFRADGIASYLYGITLCCLLMSDLFRKPRWSWMTVFCAALLCWNRTIAGIYLGVSSALLLAFCLYQSRRSQESAYFREVVRGMLKYGSAFAALTLPILALTWRSIFSYYVVGHVTGPEKKIRAMEQGVRTVFDSLSFYPLSLLHQHLGKPVTIVAICLLAAAGMVALLGRWGRGVPPASTNPFAFRAHCYIPLLWIATPMAILTLDEAKSPVVASITVVPCVVFLTFMLYRLILAGPPRLARGALGVLSAGALFAGMTVMADAEGRPYVHSYHAAEIRTLMKAFDDIAYYCEYFNLKEPKFATDRILEYFVAPVARVVMFERTRLRTDPLELAATSIFERAPEVLTQAARQADCALLTLDSVEKAKLSVYPYDRSAVNWQTAYADVVRREMIPIARIGLGGHNFQIFLRPRVRIEGGSHGWITDEGIDLRASARVLRRWPIIRLSGTTIGSLHLKGQLQAAVSVSGLPDGIRTLPSQTTIFPGESYEIVIDTSGFEPPDSQLVQMHVSFDRYFIPKELGINSDPRKLVIQFPKSSSMGASERLPATTSPELSVHDLYP